MDLKKNLKYEVKDNFVTNLKSSKNLNLNFTILQ